MSIKQKVMKEPHIDWANLVFMAEANGESFQELKITTLKSHYEDVVCERAWSRILINANGEAPEDTEELIEKQATQIMDAKQVYVKEFIKVNDDYSVEVCVDRSIVTDIIVEEVLNLLAEIGIKPNTIIEFGEAKTFSSDEIHTHKQVSKIGMATNHLSDGIYPYVKWFDPYGISRTSQC